MAVRPRAKQEVESLLSRLPDDCSLEDIQYHLYVLEKVRAGLESARHKRWYSTRRSGANPREMAYKVVWSPEALQDIQEIADYISNDSEFTPPRRPIIG
jgi:hypothetical protein